MKDENKRAETVLKLLALLAVLCLIWGATSCRSVQVVTEYKDREVVKVELQHDSVYLHDSVYIAQRGDTVFWDRWHTEYQYKYVNRVDSFVQIDSIPYPVEVKVPGPVRNSTFASFCEWFFWILVILTAVVVGIRVYVKIVLRR